MEHWGVEDQDIASKKVAARNRKAGKELRMLFRFIKLQWILESLLAVVEVGDEPAAVLEDEVHPMPARFAGGLAAFLPQIPNADRRKSLVRSGTDNGFYGIEGKRAAIAGDKIIPLLAVIDGTVFGRWRREGIGKSLVQVVRHKAGCLRK